MSEFVCGICGKKFNKLEEYLTHVSKCATQKETDEINKKKADSERAEKKKKYESAIEVAEKNLKDIKDKYAKEFPKAKAFEGKVNGDYYANVEDFLNALEKEWFC
jgi:hypothetical protein